MKNDRYNININTRVGITRSYACGDRGYEVDEAGTLWIESQGIHFEQELNLMELSEIEQRIECGPLTSWETEHWDELEEMLFLKRREMGAE